MQVSPQNTKGKSNMIYDDETRYPGTDKWMVSIVVEQGRILSKFEYKMTSYDPKTLRAFFEPVKTTKPMRAYYSPTKRSRPQIASITLLEYNHGRITAEEQISFQPLSFSVNEPGTFCLFHDRSFWHMYVQVSTDEDCSRDSNKKKDPQRWVKPLGFEVEVVMDDFIDKKSPNVFVKEEFIETDDVQKPKNRNVANIHDFSAEDVVTPPPVTRSTSSFPFHNRTFTEWCVHKPSGKWRSKFKKFGNNIRSAFTRTRF